ncbi:Kelch repeat-containing protein [Pseudoalteromonas luteoviolacea]|uniref:Galactose oxidase n=1 Tax=Pseudoalteromonas luteoviolacea S4054 TaxID=1129367 RepID=A0A0F6A8H3_9GAMM|nr:kelch repeat-containing protein [Pseudoalteromonas luteoviolacea]AOT07649.1 hypothetical protein S4054249_07245 [Pseudoalteromonas luteoviolacea]AOT12565.1 hypothetical protein S40542_07245 [Pseudoalteromonas luteoviolacea]AOT17479.1 hypothetical protein S4054_07245 [Pseudoalteromonas luteoviolacea]KKE82423.1 hypothetical protein N479_18590 [Pseudoalteromonas luteoviolacea S4054]KZN66312.1 hypothetical protein N481_24260 [Pseudoalteromonas luteoviolacea S4047-1]
MRFLSAKMNLVLQSCFLLSGLYTSNVWSGQNTSDNSSYIWQEAPSLPIAFQEVYPSVFKERIIVGGGFTPSQSPSFFGLGPSKDVFLLNPPTGRWQKAPSLPESRHHIGMVSNRHYVYGIGGYTGPKSDAWQIQRTVFRLDGKFQKWRSGPSLPIPLAESVYANVGKYIHVIGGKTMSSKTGKKIDSNAHYVLVNNAYWRKAKPPSIERSSAASAVIGNKIYVFGGRALGEGSKNLDYAEVYDTKMDTWTEISSLPVASAGLSASVLDGKIIVTGGEVFGPNHQWEKGKAFNSAWSYDPETDQWSSLPDMPLARHGHGSVTLNNTLFLIGGAAKVGPQQTLQSTFSLQRINK